MGGAVGTAATIEETAGTESGSSVYFKYLLNKEESKFARLIACGQALCTLRCALMPPPDY